MENVSTTLLPRVSSPRLDRATWLKVYVVAVSLLGIAILSLALTRLPADWFGLFIFACLAGIAEVMSVQLFSTSRGSTVSVSSIISTASVFLFGPLPGALVSIVSAAATTLTAPDSEGPVKGRASWFVRSTFNIGMFATSTAFGGLVFVATGGVPGDMARWSNLVPLVLAVTADTFANLVLLIGIISLQTDKNPWSIWKQDFRWSVPINLAGGIFGGGALAFAYWMFHLPGLVVFFLPILSTSYSFRLYIRNTKGYVEKLEKLNRDLDDANTDLLETLGAVIDADDIYTYGHSTQVATYAAVIADKLKLPRAQLDVLVKAALVHDIGKVGVKDSILSKEEPLTKEEYNLIKRHATIGAGIIGRMKGLHDLVPLVKHHHERWDGKGYPDGLEGEDIPLPVRILTLADTLDALCSDRPYRSTMSFREVKEEIVRCSGTQFDPQVVKALFALMEEKDRDFFKNSAANVDRNLLMRERESGEEGVRYVKRSMIADD